MDHQPELTEELDALLEAAHQREMCIEPQLRRFARAVADPGAPAGPSPSPTASSVHMVVPR